LFLGDDNQFVQIAVDGKVCIGTYGTEGHFWQFGTDGTTSFPNNAITTSNTPLTIQTKLPATYGPFYTAYFESGNGSVNGVHPGTYAGYFSITTVNINNDGTYSVSGYPASIQNGTNPTYTISGVDLGGTSPANDCLLTVTTVDDIITNVVVSGTALLPKWTFGTDGSLTLPGAIITTANTSSYTSTTVTVDITALVNKLVPQATTGAPHYYIPPGTDGQIMYLVPANIHNDGSESTTISFDNARWSSGAGPIYISEGARPSWLPFAAGSAVVTIIFANGAWNLPY